MFATIAIFEIIIMLTCIAFPVIALIDILRNEFEGNNKLMWVIIVIFFNIIGSILYFALGKKYKLNK